MIKRSDSHRVDTLAIRKILNILSENWVLRNLEERDYGIDLMFERFNGEKPLGQVCLVQVKGTTEAITPTEEAKISDFPTKTLLYGDLFDIPFFIFYCSITSNLVRYVNVEGYLKHRIDKDSPNGKSQGTVTIHFPPENTLSAEPESICQILDFKALRKSALEYIIVLEELKLHWESVKVDQFKVALTCNELFKKLLVHQPLIQKYLGAFSDPNDLNKNAGGNAFKRIATEEFISEDDFSEIEIQISILNAIKTAYLSHDEINGFVQEIDPSYTPY